MTDKYVMSGGVRLWTEAAGPPEGPPLLLVAGANASSRMWPGALVARMAQAGLRVIRYDHRDTGRSERRDFDACPYSVEDLARDAVAVLDGWGAARGHLAGLSLGGTIGQLVALDHPERLLSLTLMMTTALDVDFAGAWMRALRGESAEGPLPTPRPDVVARLAGMYEPGATLEAELDRRVAQWRALAGAAVPFDAAEFRAREAEDIRHSGRIAPPTAHARARPADLARGRELTRLRVPTLVVQAAEDPLNPPPHGRRLAERIPGARFVEVQGLGHALPGWAVPRLADEIVAHARAARAG